MSQPIVDWIHTYIVLKTAALVPDSDFLFPSAADPSKPLSPSAWTRLVKAVWKRHSGVPLCPKASRCDFKRSHSSLSVLLHATHPNPQDLRSSFITWLKSGTHSDKTLRSAAAAMRHSSKMQASAAYDKEGSNRLVAAAVTAASAYAGTFVPLLPPRATASA